MSRWFDSKGQTAAFPAVLDDLLSAQVVLLGEQHNRADHHRWQLHVAAALAGRRQIVMGFEMFPASADPVLEEWVAGQLDEDAFLEKVDWGACWGFPADLYLPLFRFCREMGVGMRGLNVPRTLVRAVGAGGWEAVPEAGREGLTPARPSPMPYREFIFKLTGGQRPDRAAQAPDDPAFDRFIRAQEVWDRAFATRLARIAQCDDAPLAVGIIGMGHLQFGGGVPWQLHDLDVMQTKVAVPRSRDDERSFAGADWNAVVL